MGGGIGGGIGGGGRAARYPARRVIVINRYMPANVMPTAIMMRQLRQRFIRPRRWIFVACSLLALVRCSSSSRDRGEERGKGTLAKGWHACWAELQRGGGWAGLGPSESACTSFHGQGSPGPHLRAGVERGLRGVEQLAPLPQPPLHRLRVGLEAGRQPR